MLQIEKTFEFNEYKSLIAENIDIFLFSKQREERGNLEQKMKDVSDDSLVFLIDYLQEENEIHISDIKTGTQAKISLSGSNSDLVSYFSSLICEDKNFLIDMTDMDVKILAMLIAVLKILKTRRLFVMYTEPMRYLTRKVQREKMNELSEVNEFEFHDKYQGVESIPYYMHTDVDYTSKKQLWIVFLGFDRNRTNILYESKDEPKNVIPVITHPSARPGWDKYAFNANFNFISDNGLLQEIRYVPYSSPFQTYQLLEELYNEYSDFHLIISPLGTKPNTLGSILFVNKNPEVELLYDNPYIKRARSEGILKTLIYDVSGLLNV